MDDDRRAVTGAGRRSRGCRIRHGTLSGVPHHRLIRYTGLAGAVLLAGSAQLGGALPRQDPAADGLAMDGRGLLVLCCWLFGVAVFTAAWWAARDDPGPLRRVAATAALWAAPFLVIPPMGSRDVYSYACQGHLYAAGRDPYEVGVSALPCPWIDSISTIWWDTPAPYGPLFMVLAGAVVTTGLTLTPIVLLFRAISVVGVLLTAVAVPVLARRCGVSPERALWCALAAPSIGIHLVGGAHNDALMLGLLTTGLALIVARPGRPQALLAGGALLGLAVAVKAPAAVVLPFAALAAVGGPFALRSLLRDGAWLVTGALGALVAASVGARLGVGWIAALGHSQDLVQFTSPPTAVGMTITYVGRAFDPAFTAVPAVRAVAALALLGFVVILWWRSRPDADLPARAPLRGGALALGATVALAPSFHPWYLLWPLVLSAATTARPRWIAGVTAVSGLLVLPDGGGLARHVKAPGAVLMTTALLMLALWYARRSRADAAPGSARAERRSTGGSSRDNEQTRGPLAQAPPPST